MGIEEAGGSLHNGGAALISRDLEDGALGVGEDGEQAQTDVLGHHVEHKRVRERLCLAGLNLQAVLDNSQVAHDALVGGDVLGEVLGGPQGAIGEEELDGAIFVVGDLDEGGRGAAIDQLKAEDVGIGERGSDVGIQGGGLSRWLNRLLICCALVLATLYMSCSPFFLHFRLFPPGNPIVTSVHGGRGRGNSETQIKSIKNAPLEQLRQRPARPEKRGETT